MGRIRRGFASGVGALLCTSGFAAVTLLPAHAAVGPCSAPTPSGSTRVDFTYTGAKQSFTVPTGVTALAIDLCGASGGANGGPGANVKADLAVSPGDSFDIYVGQVGAMSGTQRFNGGGAGNAGSSGDGGGATDVRPAGGGLGSRLLVAGAGGGGGMACAGSAGAAGGGSGNDGATSFCDATGSPLGGSGGKAGTSTDGGLGGVGDKPGRQGSSGTGGDSGELGDCDGEGDTAGGAGGGGYYGGGSGAADGCDGGGSGGGGSSYIGGTGVSDASLTEAIFSGNGKAVITYETPIVPSADLSITKTDGVTTVKAGSATHYTVTASNNGADNVVGAKVVDSLPAELTGASWTCAASGGATCMSSGSGSIDDTVNLPVGSSVTYDLTATVSSTAGSVANKAEVKVPAGVDDPTPTNNSATDTDTILPVTADLSVTKNDGVTSITAGDPTIYLVVVANAGPDAVADAKVVDTMPSELTGVTWSCQGAAGAACGNLSGSGSIDETVSLPSGSSVAYTIHATVSSSASGSVANKVTVTSPPGVTDPVADNNTVTDTDTINPIQADLSITKTDGTTTVTAGDATTYTITASNGGPNNAVGAKVVDTLPAGLSGASWTCAGTSGATCTASGSGDINDTVNLPTGSSVTYTVTATVLAGSSVANTAKVSAPSGVIDAVPGNDSATDTDTIIPRTADLSITKTDGVTSVDPGAAVTYTITASNAGPDPAPAAKVTDVLPAGLTNATWTSSAAGGATGNETSGTGDINDVVSLPAGGSVTYTLSATVAAGATGSLANTAAVEPPAGFDDPNVGNNSATDTDTLNDLCAPTTSDCDHDGLTRGQEAAGPGLCGTTPTDPENPDTDGDGLSDGTESKGVTITQKVSYNAGVPKNATPIGLVKPNPCAKDTDGDKLSDGVEVKGSAINQWVKREKKYGNYTITSRKTNPLLKDTDKDGASDRQEITGSLNTSHGNHRSDPTNADTDWGGGNDGTELKRHTDPVVAGG